VFGLLLILEPEKHWQQAASGTQRSSWLSKKSENHCRIKTYFFAPPKTVDGVGWHWQLVASVWPASHSRT
jgi:hypothetical protein